jgi:hypothetical protein
MWELIATVMELRWLKAPTLQGSFDPAVAVVNGKYKDSSNV